MSPKTWCFHMNHGVNVELSEDRDVAINTFGNNGIVLSDEPMDMNKLYEVEILDTQYPGCDTIYCSHTWVGAVFKDPAELGPLPKWSGELSNDERVALVYRPYSYWYNGEQNNAEHKPPELANVRVGQRVGVAIDRRRQLHVFVDGQDLGVILPGVSLPHPCYALFDMYIRIREVKTLPITTVRLSVKTQTAQEGPFKVPTPVL